MGVDYLLMKAKRHVKRWDRSKRDMVRRDLFSRDAGPVETALVARTVGDRVPLKGDVVLVRAEGAEIVVLADLDVQAVCVKPTEAVRQRIVDTGGYANGLVEASHPTLHLIQVRIT